MDDKVPENSIEPEHTPMLRESLAPAKVANFPGSLVANHLGSKIKSTAYPQEKANVANWVAYFRDGWDDLGLWKSAVSIRPKSLETYIPNLLKLYQWVETCASFLLCYLSGMIDTTITNFGTSQAPAYAGVVNIFLLSLFIMAFAPGSGGQFR